jgi:hypothetical protein
LRVAGGVEELDDEGALGVPPIEHEPILGDTDWAS